MSAIVTQVEVEAPQARVFDYVPVVVRPQSRKEMQRNMSRLKARLEDQN